MAKQDLAGRAEQIETTIQEAVTAAIEIAGDEADVLLYLAGLLRRQANAAQRKVNQQMRERVKQIERSTPAGKSPRAVA